MALGFARRHQTAVIDEAKAYVCNIDGSNPVSLGTLRAPVWMGNDWVVGMVGYANDFEFDYAGNLYAVSNAGERLSVWAMPTSDNSCITPARKSLVLNSVYTGIENTEVITRIAPNPTTGLIHISAAAEIENVEIYDIAGAQVMRLTHIGANTVTVDLTDLASGIYFVKVNNGKAVKVIKR